MTNVTDKKILFGTTMSWLNKLVMILANILVLPFLFRLLDHEVLGIWLLLAQGASFVIMLDFGISPILQRKVAFVRGNVGNASCSKPNNGVKEEVAQILATARALYQRIIVLSFLIMWGTGWYFLQNLETQNIDNTLLFSSWTILCLGYAITIFSLLWSSVLYGFGHVGWETLITLVTTVLLQAALLTGVALGGGLLYLAITTSFFSIVSRFLVYLTMQRLEGDILRTKANVDFSILRGWGPFAFRYWVTSVSAFFLLKTDQAFIAYFLDPVVIPKYHATLQIFTALMSIGLALSQATQPFISQKWAAGKADEVLTMTRRNLVLAIAIIAAGASVMLNAGEEFFHIWLGPGQFVGTGIVLIFATMATLETQHMVFASSSRATNYEGFAVVALISAMANLVITWLLVQSYGLIGVALGTLVAQLFTNNWFVVYVSIRRLQIPIAQYLNWALLLITIYATTFSVSVLTRIVAQPRLTELHYIALQIAMNVIVLGLITWFIVFTADEKTAMMRRLARRQST